MERIRYEAINVEKTILKSVKLYQHPTNGARYKIILNTSQHKWEVVDDVTDGVTLSGHHVHPVKLRLEARKALESLGVVLNIEKRKPRTPKIKAA